MTVVEREEKFLHLSREYFGLLEDENQKVVLTDGVQFIKNIKSRVAVVNLLHRPVLGYEQKYEEVSAQHITLMFQMIKELFKEFFARCYVVLPDVHTINELLGCTKAKVDQIDNEESLERRLEDIYKEFDFNRGVADSDYY
ncbi:unnamed protein product [Gongylonema pulchrum]|uniref:DHC_N1 domain-containing protein n=1 Tax=Gongylonema pulchrum TaxID=637853 RepID=A0A183CXZ7_9BILA|nr:unnamed protein product [Gongylonema pulchrum]